jgi:hypothetical protein
MQNLLFVKVSIKTRTALENSNTVLVFILCMSKDLDFDAI